MMKKNLTVFLVFLFAFVSFNPIGRIYTNEPVSKEGELNFYVNLNNALKEKLDDIRVRAYIYDIGEVVYSNDFDIGRKSTRLSRMSWKVSDAVTKGEYMIKVSASNDKFRDSKHIIVEVE
ncbi:MAG: hypothetical protein AABY14_01895 [Nanoarchaeota archaeon]